MRGGYKEQQRLRLVGEQISGEILRHAAIVTPAMIERNVDRFYQLGEPAGPTMLQLVAVLAQHNALVEQISRSVISKGWGEWPKDLEHLEGHLRTLETLTKEAVVELETRYSGNGATRRANSASPIPHA